MWLAGSGAFFTTTLSIFVIWFNITNFGLAPWKGWADTHSNFSRIIYLRASVWHYQLSWSITHETLRWIYVFCAFVFFAFFGFAKEARENYRAAALCIAKRLRMSRISRYLASFPHYFY
jgi:pheromone a factor receptor